MLRFLFAIALIGHGLAHLSGFLASWTKGNVGYSSHPWIFSHDVLLTGTVGRIFGLIWLVAMVLLAGSGFGIIFRQSWWPLATLIGSIISLVVIIPWWNAVPPGARIGVFFNLLIIFVVATPIREKILELIS